MKIKIANSQKDVFNCVRVRLNVFVGEQGVDFSLEQEKRDDEAIHYLVYNDEGEGIGTCRLLEEEESVLLGRLAVLKAYRGKHIGESLLKAVEQDPTVLKKGKIILHAQLHAKGFYEKCGYRAVGEIFYEAGIAHVLMEKKI